MHDQSDLPSLTQAITFRERRLLWWTWRPRLRFLSRERWLWVSSCEFLGFWCSGTRSFSCYCGNELRVQNLSRRSSPPSPLLCRRRWRSMSGSPSCWEIRGPAFLRWSSSAFWWLCRDYDSTIFASVLRAESGSSFWACLACVLSLVSRERPLNVASN